MAKKKAIDLFAGAGGFSLGLQQAGIDVVAAVEIDKWCVDTLNANKSKAFPKMKVIQKDICTLSGEYLLDQVALAKGQLDMLVGGPPCQGFSFASSRRSIKDPRSRLMWEFVRLVKEIQPRFFCIENVRGLMSFKDFFRFLLMKLEKCGYVVRFNLLDCCSYGVPQRRQRVLIDGARKDLGVMPAYPPPTHFSPKQLENKTDISPALVAVKCFATHGFDKSEVHDVWWNTKLEILMNKKTAAETVNQAVNEIIAETLFNHIENERSHMAKKKSNVTVGDPMLIDVHPANEKELIEAATLYQKYLASRQAFERKEVEQKQKILLLTKAAKIKPLPSGITEFTVGGIMIKLTPREILVQIKDTV